MWLVLLNICEMVNSSETEDWLSVLEIVEVKFPLAQSDLQQ